MHPRALHAARIALGSIVLIGGINGFVRIVPVPEPPHPFVELLIESGFIYAVKTVELLAAALLLLDRRRPLALALLWPIVVNIALFHLLLDPRAGINAVVLLGLLGALTWHERRAFAPLFAEGRDPRALCLPRARVSVDATPR
ncbi:transporter [Sorangium cellulosum]|uniref:Transporter n=1 Tax=Sorangium cellulosum TaxID=56 RepID=A0A2L0F7I5_SORCE|nr:membrane spanning transport protein [Sorangium cellulosum]AUX47492.1 transporter [Sorangium cellulosum]